MVIIVFMVVLNFCICLGEGVLSCLLVKVLSSVRVVFCCLFIIFKYLFFERKFVGLLFEVVFFLCFVEKFLGRVGIELGYIMLLSWCFELIKCLICYVMWLVFGMGCCINFLLFRLDKYDLMMKLGRVNLCLICDVMFMWKIFVGVMNLKKRLRM